MWGLRIFLNQQHSIMSDFKPFKQLVQERMTAMVAGHPALFIVDIPKEDLWNAYLENFDDPDEKQEHNCSCCRGFIKNYGGLVTIIDGKLQTIWDFTPHEHYAKSVRALHKLVSEAKIRNLFITKFGELGTDSNIQLLEDMSTRTWEHFSFTLPRMYVNTSHLSRESLVGVNRDNRNVFKRSLETITMDAIETVLELIAQNSLYRGDEHKKTVSDFYTQKKAFDACPNKEEFSWELSTKLHESLLKIRNTSIGTLLIDISEGKELDHAVTAFEKMMAPANYKRPNPIVTKGMVEEAEAKAASKAKAERRKEILEILAAKEGEALKAKTIDELKAELAGLE